jgi:lactoylglutathione lyase
MGNVQGLFHVGITVSDMAESVRFYRDGLGLDYDWEKTGDADYIRALIGLDFESIHNVFMKIPGGGTIELLDYHGIERHSAAARPCDPGSGHMCLFVQNIEAVVAQAERSGGKMRSREIVTSPTGPAAGCKFVYMTDPDGFVIELLERTGEMAEATFSGGDLAGRK